MVVPPNALLLEVLTNEGMGATMSPHFLADSSHHPKAYFNDRLVDALDDLLAAPQFEESPRLSHPNVLYEFADPDLQERSASQKTMIRMGYENAEQIKAKLREIRRQVTRTPGTS